MLYIITAPKDVAEVFKRADVLEWDGHLNQIFLNFGMNPESLKQAWLKPSQADARYLGINPQQLSLIRLVERIYAQQLLPGVHMDEIGSSFVTALHAAFRLPNLEISSVRADNGARAFSLRTLCQYTLLEAGIYSFFGKTIMEMDNNIIPNLLAFTDNAWMLFYGLPSFLASAVLVPQKTVLETFQRFADLPENLRNDQSWSVQRVLIAQECVGMDTRSKACMLAMILWAANSNVNNAAFWVLARILFDEQLREAVKEEVNAAWKSEHLDVKSLCANATVLDGTFHECLRLSAGAMMGRKVLEATRIGDKILKPGGTVLVPSRQLHSNANVWGTDHQQFSETRFAKNGSLVRHSSYRPFGGGVSLCPGRKLAREQVFTLVAILIHRFDVRLSHDKKQKFPQLNVSTPALGVTGPAKDMDVYVELNQVEKST
ncbi:MAG: hypothetical protein L6R38_006366 [Xanthoria sp. 2 TBL-2021]|nr:MAG: hypothetical protein L6R38_006366 [Xanthoria sp. 2 TBL-2021]